jgi:hypothetical protein
MKRITVDQVVEAVARLHADRESGAGKREKR